MKKKILTILLCILTCFCFCSCGGGEEYDFTQEIEFESFAEFKPFARALVRKYGAKIFVFDPTDFGVEITYWFGGVSSYVEEKSKENPYLLRDLAFAFEIKKDDSQAELPEWLAALKDGATWAMPKSLESNIKKATFECERDFHPGKTYSVKCGYEILLEFSFVGPSTFEISTTEQKEIFDCLTLIK